MDPNEALRLLRAACDRLDSDEEFHDATDVLYEHFRALDEWLTKGGFPPDAWRYGNEVAERLADASRDPHACPRCLANDPCLRPTCPHPVWRKGAEQVEARGHWPGDGCGPATLAHFAPPYGTGDRP